MLSPIGQMRADQRLEQLPLVGYPQVQELVCNYEILKARLLLREVVRERDDAAVGAGTPLRVMRCMRTIRGLAFRR